LIKYKSFEKKKDDFCSKACVSLMALEAFFLYVFIQSALNKKDINSSFKNPAFVLKID